MREILGDENEPFQETRTRSANLERGEETGIEFTGPVDIIEDLYEADLAGLGTDPEKTTLSFNTSKGRATYRITNARTVTGGVQDPVTGGLQELVAIDVIRPWYTAPYFRDLTTVQIAAIRKAVEDGVEDIQNANVGGGELAYILFAHMIRGDNYYETAYIFRRTFRTNSNQTLLLAAGNINRVVDLPPLNSTVSNLIDTLPPGEWLKRPTSCRYLGREGWDVQDEYLWAPQWSVVYGGTFTGLDE
jgi:hypothetical protein